MKKPIATLAILIGCVISLACLRADRFAPMPDPPPTSEASCDCGCDEGDGCFCCSINGAKKKRQRQASPAETAISDDGDGTDDGGVWSASIAGKVAPDGAELQIDLPGSQHLRNKGGNDRTRNNPRGEPGKGLGLCVFTSIDHAARWANVTSLIDFRDWMTTKPGGGYPAKVDAMIAARCKALNVPAPEYIQLEGGRELLDILRAALTSNRMVSVTYSFSPSGRYGGGRIAHMVNLVHLDAKSACVLDNNYIEPKENAYEWITVDEFVRTFTGGRAGWAVILIDAGPPPLPFN